MTDTAKVRRYAVKSIFGPTIQGEGSLTGAVTAFVRLAGCNMWSGREKDRASSACPFCDTDFVGGDRLTARDIVAALRCLLDAGGLVTVSGGEPLLQLDLDLARSLVDAGYRVAIETNGTRAIDPELRALLHVTCSPKVPREEMVLADCDDLKVLVPHPDERITPAAFSDFPARSRWVQPVNLRDVLNHANVRHAVDVAIAMPGDWRVSIQLHKLLGVA